MIDFRSDTVTRPSVAMKKAMFEAPLGDDVFGDDPSVNQLQALAAKTLGFEAGLFAPSGTQANLIALMSHCQRGDEAIVGQQWHTYRWEAGGMAVLGSIQPQAVENQADGRLKLSDIEAAIKPDDAHFAKTRLIVIENTTGGKVLPLDYMQDVAALAHRRGLACHIDGARLMNAAVAQNPQDPLTQVKSLCAGFDSVSLCLSKGLGAPIGSVLVGSQAFISRAKRMRKMLGGGLRQAGLLAAAGTFALENHVHRLDDDHTNAQLLSDGLQMASTQNSRLKGRLTSFPANTNILFMDLDAALSAEFSAYLLSHDILITSSTYQSNDRAMSRYRWVTHLDVSRADILKTIDLVLAF